MLIFLIFHFLKLLPLDECISTNFDHIAIGALNLQALFIKQCLITNFPWPGYSCRTPLLKHVVNMSVATILLKADIR